MKRVKKLFVRIHIGLWLLFLGLVSLQLGGENNPNALSATAATMSCALYVFYTHIFLLNRYSGKKERRPYLLSLLGLFLTGPLPFLFFRSNILNTGAQVLSYYCMVMVSLVAIFVFLSWLARVTENLVLNTIRKEQLEKQAVEAELYYLKSQINPHFLFNTLNNIHTLVFKQAPAAPEAVMRLASLMRYMIYESNATLVPLSREMDYLKDYMSLQQLRYKKSPVVDLEIEGDLSMTHIAPLLFIHLLENAYKHSPARAEPRDIKVRVSVSEQTLNFSIQNPIVEKSAQALEQPGGIGLQNVRKRLALLYPEKHSLEIFSEAGMFNVFLTISGIDTQTHETQAQLLYH